MSKLTAECRLVSRQVLTILDFVHVYFAGLQFIPAVQRLRLELLRILSHGNMATQVHIIALRA